ncbi:MAG: MerR family transcriptional regulator [Chitinophagales bacterium]
MASIYSIRDLERLSGIKAHTIRIWEQRYGILKVSRTSTNIRFYNDDELKYLLSLALLNRSGWKISKLAKMSRSEISEAVDKLAELDTDFRVQIEALVEATLNFDETKFEKILNTSILQIGFEETMKKLIFPFLEKLGVLWVSGAMMAAQEHFITQLIRQKILVGIDAYSGKSNENSKKFLLFLPNGA